MRKEIRVAEQILTDLGLKILDSGRGRHHFWILELPSGRQIKQPIPHNTTQFRFWHNWKAQLRRHINEDAGAVIPGRTKSAG